MKKKTKLLSLVLAVLMLFAIPLTSTAHSFTDVTDYSEAIGALSEIGVIKGYSETKFGPNVDVTRWQMALLMARLLTGNTDENNTYWNVVTSDFPFKDIDTGSHYPTAIKYASDNGIIKGVTATEFKPTKGINLQEGLTMAVRALGYPAAAYDTDWPDNYILKAKTLDLLIGLENMSFTQIMTRGQTAQLLYNMLYAKKYDGTTLASTLMTGEKLVLVATETRRLTDSYSYARSGRLVFAPIQDNGTLGEAVTIQANLLNIANTDTKIGYCYDVISKNYYSEITKCTERPAVTYTSGLTLNATSGILKINNTNYLVSNVLSGISGSRYDNIIVYGSGSAYTRASVLTASDIEGTTAYYTITCFDDDGDGDFERAIYTPYIFGQYKTDASGRVSIAGNTLATALKFKNVKPANNDYVAYSYDAQTSTLDVLKKFPTSQGVLTNVSGGYAKIANTNYVIGNEEFMNAGSSTMSTISSHVNNNITCILDGNYLLAVINSTAGTTTGDPLATNTVAIVSAIDANNVSLSLSNGQTSPIPHTSISTVDGAAYTGYGSSIFGGANTQLAVGDVITYTYSITSYTLNHVKTPTFVTAAPTTLDYQNGYFMILSNANSAGGTEGAVKQLLYAVGANVPVYTYSGNTLSNTTVSRLTNTSLSANYAIFITYSGSSNLAKTATMIIIVPYNSTKMSLTPTFNTGTGTGTGSGTVGTTISVDFDGIVYVSNPTLSAPANNVYTLTSGVYNIGGGTTAVTYNSTGYLAPTFTTGYYYVKNGVITGMVSAATSNSTAGITFYMNTTIANISPVTDFLGTTIAYYSMTINGQNTTVLTLPTFLNLSGNMITPWPQQLVVGAGTSYTADIYVTSSGMVAVLHNPNNPFA